MVFLSALILLFSLILVRNSEGKGGVLIGYVFLGLIGINLLKYQGFVYLLILQIILFIFLLRKTAWLEELTKIECWTYLIIVFFTFRGISKFNLFQEIEANQFEQALIWYTLPQFLYLLFKMYLLAVLVKLPIVLIYNFARLSRKLKISSLFQSTFPQIIQLCMLLLIFYFFIAGWQADKVREAMINQVDLLISGKASTAINLFKVAQDKSGSILYIKGYQPINFSGKLPPEGVLTVAKAKTLSNLKQVDYFLFFKSFDSNEESVYFVKLDSSFMELVSTNSSILTGSHLLAYPDQPPSWESYVYELTNWKQTHSLRIFPFGLTPQRKDDTLSARFNLNQQSSPEWIDTINKRITEHNQFTIGQVIAPLINLSMEQTGFFAFDILLLPDVSFFTSTLLTYILFLVLIYFLVNLLVIRRMVKFGSEINQMIVQKFNQLRNGIREISTGNLDYKVKLEGRDEFVELAEHFNQMGDKLKESIAEAREKERLQHELTIARQVQLDMLPLTLPEIPGFQIAATLKTANEVGGDFYDMLPLNNNRYLFTVGDVSGKSTSAAFYMAQCISLIRYSPQFTDQPREIVLRLNKYFAGPLVDRQIFVTAVVGMLDVDSSTLRMVRAGHPLPIFLPGEKTEQLRELNYDGIGIGLERSG
ncbi:MAG: SpoIIE family protein phosphatase, partial [bacterium]